MKITAASIIFSIFLNITRAIVVCSVLFVWGMLSIKEDTMIIIPWEVVATVAMLYGEKGVDLLKYVLAILVEVKNGNLAKSVAQKEL